MLFHSNERHTLYSEIRNTYSVLYDITAPATLTTILNSDKGDVLNSLKKCLTTGFKRQNAHIL